MTPFTYDYPRPAVTVDIAVFARRGDELLVLLIQRKNEPFKGAWALPGGFVDKDEALVDAARRELREETGLSGLVLTQVGAFGDPGRDPRGHTVSVAFVTETNADTARVMAGDDAAKAEWHAWTTLCIASTGEGPPAEVGVRLAFDHDRVLVAARAALARDGRVPNSALQ